MEGVVESEMALAAALEALRAFLEEAAVTLVLAAREVRQSLCQRATKSPCAFLQRIFLRLIFMEGGGGATTIC